MKRIEVAAAIIRREGRILLCRRGEGGNCAFLWEFPGGKLENGETPEECLKRECREELSIDIEVGSLYERFDYDYPDKAIRFHFFEASIQKGEPVLTVHREARWLWPRELKALDACPADRGLVERLSGELPFGHYLWDFDGTLFDTYPRIASAMQAAFADFGHEMPYREVLALAKRSVSHALDTLREKFETKATQEELIARYRFHEGGYSAENAAPLYPGIKELLAQIVRRGGKNYLYTHRGPSSLQYLEGYGIGALFAGSITGRDPYPPKPAPDAILMLMKRHGMDRGRVVMVGDRDIDLQAALNAGAAGCLFDPDGFYADFAAELRAASVKELQTLLLGL